MIYNFCFGSINNAYFESSYRITALRGDKQNIFIWVSGTNHVSEQRVTCSVLYALRTQQWGPLVELVNNIKYMYMCSMHFLFFHRFRTLPTLLQTEAKASVVDFP